jgi:hypothetical protein
MNDSYKHIEAAASQAGVSYEEALAKIHSARQLSQQAMANQGKTEVCDMPNNSESERLRCMTVADVLRIVDANSTRQDIERALRANLAQPEQLPAWQDVLGDAEQFVRQKPIFAKYIKGSILENDVPVWMGVFALRLLQRDRARR